MFMLIFNVIFMVLLWVWAIESFQTEGDNVRGWAYLFSSAVAGALILSSLF